MRKPATIARVFLAALVPMALLLTAACGGEDSLVPTGAQGPAGAAGASAARTGPSGPSLAASGVAGSARTGSLARASLCPERTVERVSPSRAPRALAPFPSQMNPGLRQVYVPLAPPGGIGGANGVGAEEP